MIDGLYENFKFWSEGCSVWIISDTHFDDPDCKLIDENWVSPQKQVEIINKSVNAKDTLICLGDCGNTDYFKQINVNYKILIKGNHDGRSEKYKRNIFYEYYNPNMNTIDEIKNIIAEKYPSFKYHIEEDYEYSFPDLSYKVTLDNGLFDEIYDGPLFISKKLLLSHEPILGNPNCFFNIHGHEHKGVKFSENGLNVAANVCKYKPVNLKQFIKDGHTSKIKDIHRVTVDKAIQERKERKQCMKTQE